MLAHKRATAQQKQAVLQRILCDVQSAQHKEAVRAQQLAKQTRQAAEKEASYKLNMEKMTHKLEKNGFTPQVGYSNALGLQRVVVVVVLGVKGSWMCVETVGSCRCITRESTHSSNPSVELAAAAVPA